MNTEFFVFGLPFGRLQTLQWFDSEIRNWQATQASRTVSLKAWYHQNADWNVTANRLAMLSETEIAS